MKVRVSLYGTLGRDFPGYRHTAGLDVEIADGATVADLLQHLKISQSRGAAVSVNGRILDTDVKISDGVHANIFQTVHGG
jgi:thiamine biosynthesis protein ThiS